MKAVQKFSQPFDAAPGYIVITDANGAVLYASKGAEATTGFSVKDMLGKKPGKLWGGHMDRTFYKELWTTIEGKKNPFVAPVKNRMKGGQFRIENLHISPILSRAGDIEYYMEVQPNLQGAAAVQRFEQAFQRGMRQQSSRGGSLLPQILRWIEDRDNRAYAEELEAFAQEYKDLSSLLSDLFLSYGEMARWEDRRLIHLAQQDGNAFERLYGKYKNKVYNYLLYRVNKNSTVAEELMQETFERAFHALKKFVPHRSTYLSYLLVIAHNLLVNYYRLYQPIFVEDMSFFSDTTVHAETEEENHENSERLWSFLERFTPIEKEVIVLKYQGGLKVSAIAHRLGKSENAIKLILSRTRKKMREWV